MTVSLLLMSDVIVYMTTWCPFCHSLFEAMADQGITWDEVDVDEDPLAAAKVEQINGGNRVVPTVEFADGSTMTNPDVTAVVAKLKVLAS